MSRSRIDWDDYWAKSQKAHELTIETNESAKLERSMAYYKAETAKTAESTVKTAKLALKELNDAELARRKALYPPKQAADSIPNPNAAFRKSKLKKPFVYRDFEARARDLDCWPDDL